MLWTNIPLESTVDSVQQLRRVRIIMSEVVYFELGKRDLQVVPRAKLLPLHNYEPLERVWGHKVFNLVDVGCNENFTTRPCSARLEGSARYLATLHWDEMIPWELKYDGKFWVGPIDRYTDPHGSIREMGQDTKGGVQMSY